MIDQSSSYLSPQFKYMIFHIFIYNNDDDNNNDDDDDDNWEFILGRIVTPPQEKKRNISSLPYSDLTQNVIAYFI